MPSFFFHIVVDLIRPSEEAGSFISSRSSIFGIQKVPRPSSQTPADIASYARTFPTAQPGAGHLQALGPESSTAGPADSVSGDHDRANDWRSGPITLQCIDMVRSVDTSHTSSTTGPPSKTRSGNGITAGPAGPSVKGRYEPVDKESKELGWGIIRLFRDSEESPILDENVSHTKGSKHGRNTGSKNGGGNTEEQPIKDEDCTTLCILAVPSYMTPSDFLGAVGEKTREDVSHFRMIRTDKINRYMVLMKFRSAKTAREWRKEWDGKQLNAMQPENCHVVFVKSIEFNALGNSDDVSTFPDMANDPFSPEGAKKTSPNSKGLPSSKSLLTKPMAPPTPALIELPTCPVCLERMDESTAGLLTIACQHVFHCSCLQNWRGSGCPVCRFTHDETGKHVQGMDPDTGLNECSICRSDVNLWICLICGTVGCGRYDAAHAFIHYQQTSHCFAMDLTTQRVWDYASDGYVHRIMQNKLDGKMMELPSANENYNNNYSEDDMVPREKLDNLGQEYTHLVTSQLESQRLYFEEKLRSAADKASEAAQAASTATDVTSKAQTQVEAFQTTQDNLLKETIPTLEKERDRATRKSEKFETMARKLEKEWREEKTMTGSLMERIEFLDEQVKKLSAENAELKETNRDLSFFISGKEKLQDMGEDIQEGTVSVPEASGKGKKKNKGKGRKGGGEDQSAGG